MKILVIEDDRPLLVALEYRLRKEGLEVDKAYDGDEGLLMMESAQYDMLVLDRMLPGMSGIRILETIRAKGNSIPILMLTAMDGVADRVTGLDAGADDYLVKPFAMDELLARIRALDRRKAPWTPLSLVRAFDLELDMNTMALKKSGGEKEVVLTKTAGRLLSLFMRNANQTLPRALLIDRIWGGADVEEGNLDTQVHYIRKKLGYAKSECTITTHRSIGYKLERAK